MGAEHSGMYCCQMDCMLKIVCSLLDLVFSVMTVFPVVEGK